MRRIKFFTLHPYFFNKSEPVLELSVKTYKKIFDRELRHIKLILAHQRHQLDVKEWLQLVHDTKQSVIESSHEFFCKELPPKAVVLAAIEKVFEGFLEDQRLLAAQTSKGFRMPRSPKDLRF